MNERPKKRRGPILWLADRSRRFWIVTTLLLPALYVASLGPASWAVDRRLLPIEQTALVYEPILWVETCQPDLLAGYVFSFGDEAGRAMRLMQVERRMRGWGNLRTSPFSP